MKYRGTSTSVVDANRRRTSEVVERTVESGAELPFVINESVLRSLDMFGLPYFGTEMTRRRSVHPAGCNLLGSVSV